MLSRRTPLNSASPPAPPRPLACGFGPGAVQHRDVRPCGAGGGWDQTARSIELSMRTDGIMQTFQFEHAPGAGGAVGLPKFLGAKRGKENAVLVGGMVMVGSLIANKSPVKMTDMTPLARLTGEALALVVPASSPFKNLADVMAAMKADPGKVSIAGGSQPAAPTTSSRA